ncbi:gamma-tubulin complex component 6 isoform X2 [Ctenopharyngodon idella]|uniref:gamma-tubulin complex component 6 isoform X2 n=1 Tax=Ctenopharyngodon idella TaxID=7959 RepID=UPI0022323229|nr:gamma-tubulin complex component 6 isoform X2 [Ctenopharyngodon idella]
MSGCHGNSDSITGLLGALCDCSISGLSWKRRALGAASRESARRTLRKRAYGALLAGLFQDGLPKPPPNALANTPAHNKILMISFDLRVSGRDEEAERLEELLGQLRDGAGLSELDSVLELLVQLAGSVAPPPLSFSRDYMRRERPVQRRPPLGGYLSQDMQRLEERAWSLICGEEWGVFGGVCRTVSIMDAPPGTGLLGLGRRPDVEERFERETRLSLFGALQHSRTADMDIRLDLPPVPSNADITGLSIRVPAGLDQSDDEGFQSSSNLTPDSQSEPSPSPEFDVWEALRTFVPGRRRCWENIGCPPGQKEPPYLTEAGREAFDQLYRLWEGEMRNILSTQTPSPLLPLPLDCQSQLVKDVLNVLIGVSSATFPLNEASVQFDVRPDICVSGTSPESVSRLLCELAQYGTHYLRLSRFSLSSGSQKGLVFQAFTGGLRRYLHYYRACVLSTPASLSLLIIACHFRKLGRQLRYLSELCCVDGIAGVGRATFPMGVKLLSCLYNEAQSNCSNENHPVLLSLLKSSCEPYTRFVSDWVYSGVFRDVYKEFMIEVNEDYLTYRDKNFWTQGYTLISRDAEDCVPVFLKHIANDVYVCGKTINLLKICCPQHYIFWSDVPVPRIAVTFSLQEVEEIERDCAVYRGRMETIARHSAISREEQAMRTEQARQELINQVRETAAKTLERIRGHQVSQRLAEEAQKRERFKEMKQQLELDQEWRSAARRKEQDDDFSYARELRDREQRLQALEEQLERRARMDLIAQYGQLSEAAARRELRAMWKVQRMKLDERRVNFLQQEQQNVQALLEKFPLGLKVPPPETPYKQQPAQLHAENLSEQPTADPHIPESSAPPCSSAKDVTHALISEEIDIADFLPKPPRIPDSGAVTQALRDIGSDLLQFPQKPHATNSHIPLGQNVSEVYESVPVPSQYGQASKSSFLLGQFIPEVSVGQPKASVHGHPSQSSVQLRDSTASGLNKGLIRSESNTLTQTTQERTCEAESSSQCTEKQPTGEETGTEPSAASTGSEPKQATQEPTEKAKSCESVSQPSHCSQPEEEQSVSPLISFHESESGMRNNSRDPDPALISFLPSSDVCGHASDAHIRVGDHVSELTTPIHSANIYGHASDAHIRVGVHVSEVTTPLLTPNIHGHASDAHIRVGEHVSEVTTSLPTPSIHGHASDAHIRVGEHVSEVTTSFPTPNIHGHASDAHIRVGEHVSEVTAPFPTPNIHGHASDAHIRVGEHVSEVTAPFPTPNIHGHASDAHIRVGEHVSEITAPFPTPNIHGHASDAHIRVGEHISEVNAHIPVANIHGHASDAHIKVGEFVSDVTSSRPLSSKFGHSSDSTLKVGCVMPDAAPSSTPLPGSTYGHASDSVLTLGCVVSGIDPQRSPLPGSEYGHSSQSTLGIGCVVSGIETIRPSSLYSGDRAHTSDSTLGMGCVVGGVVPGSLYGDRLPTIFDRASEETEKPADTDTQAPPSELFSLDEGLTAWALGLGLSPKKSPEDRYLLSLASQYQVEQYQDSYGQMTAAPESELLLQVTRGPNGLPVDPSLHQATDSTAVQLSEMMPLPVLMKHSVTTPLITHVSMVNKAVVDYFFVELGVEKHFETLRHFLLMEDGEFALSLSDQLFEKLGSGQTPGELLTPLVLNSILNKALQYSVHGDSELAAHFTFALRYLPEIFHPHAPDSLNCLELRYKVDWPVNIVITDSCLNKYNRLFSFLLQLKHMVWSLRDVWFHLKRTALVKGAGRSVQFHQLQLYRHEMQHFVKVIQGYIANQILQVSWSEFTHKLSSANDLDAIHRTHAEYLNRAIFRGLLTEKAAPVMNIIHSIFSLILKFRGQLIAQPWELQQGEPVHPSFIAMQQSYNTFKYYSRFLFKVVTKLVDKGYQPHLEDFLLRINLNNYYKDS